MTVGRIYPSREFYIISDGIQSQIPDRWATNECQIPTAVVIVSTTITYFSMRSPHHAVMPIYRGQAFVLLVPPFFGVSSFVLFKPYSQVLS